MVSGFPDFPDSTKSIELVFSEIEHAFGCVGLLVVHFSLPFLDGSSGKIFS
jgi:hypothetical protein